MPDLDFFLFTFSQDARKGCADEQTGTPFFDSSRMRSPFQFHLFNLVGVFVITHTLSWSQLPQPCPGDNYHSALILVMPPRRLLLKRNLCISSKKYKLTFASLLTHDCCNYSEIRKDIQDHLVCISY